jgi:hypothetical protein
MPELPTILARGAVIEIENDFLQTLFGVPHEVIGLEVRPIPITRNG